MMQGGLSRFAGVQKPCPRLCRAEHSYVYRGLKPVVRPPTGT